jgi:hypothetical protein
VAAVAVGVAAVAWLFFAPFLEASRAGALAEREAQTFLAPAELLPGHARFPGVLLLALALLGLLAPDRRGLGPARAALAAGALLATWLAAGPQARPLPDLYALAARALPVLGAVRAPQNVEGGAHLALGVLAALGAAALLARVPRRFAGAAAAALVLAAAAEVAWRAPATDLLRVRPPEAALRFFAELEARGDRGPLLELPLASGQVLEQARSVLLSAYHRRRTSACTTSHPPAELVRVQRLAARLPDDEHALAEVARLGFRTLLLHQREGPLGAAFALRFAERRAASAHASASLPEVHADGRRRAFAIELDASPERLGPVGEPSPRG